MGDITFNCWRIPLIECKFAYFSYLFFFFVYYMHVLRWLKMSLMTENCKILFELLKPQMDFLGTDIHTRAYTLKHWLKFVPFSAQWKSQTHIFRSAANSRQTKSSYKLKIVNENSWAIFLHFANGNCDCKKRERRKQCVKCKVVMC